MKFSKRFGVALFATSLIYSAVTPGLGFAEEAEEVTSGTVTVTATRSEKALLEVPMSVTVITAEEIEKNNPLTLSDLLKDVPGIEVISNSQPNVDRLSIRGTGKNGVLFLIDGQKMSSFEIDGLQMMIDPSRIERVEVIKGPASVLYGSDAMGGVINIITKKGGEEAFQGSFRTAFNTVTDGSTNNLSAYGKTGDLSYRVGGTYENHNNYETIQRDLPNSSRKNLGFNAFVGYDFTDSLSAGASYDYTQKSYRSQASLITSTRITNTIDGATSYDENNRDFHKYAGFAEYTSLSSVLSRVRVDGFYQMDDDDSETFSIASGLKTGSSDAPIDTIGASLQADWYFFDNMYVITGYDFNQAELNQRGYSSSATTYRDGTQTSNAAFVSLENPLPLDFMISAGVRYSHVATELTNSKSVSNSTGAASVLGDPDDGSDSKMVFSAGLVWTGIENLALRAQYAQGFRSPTFYELYVGRPGTTISWLANPQLEAESSDTFEIGARYAGNAFSADVALYYGVTENLIEMDWDSAMAGKDYSYINYAKAHTYGVEFAVDYSFENGVTPYFSGSYIRKKVKEKGAVEYDFSTGTPEFTGRLGVRYDNQLPFFDNFFNFTADVYARGNTSTDENTSNFLEGHVTGNVELGLAWGEDTDYFLQANIYNIFDTEYQMFSNATYYQPGINANLVFGINF